MSIYLISFLIGAIVTYLFLRRKKKKREQDLSKEHCLVTGGSSGIGLSLALLCAKRGASVTIIARSKVRLDAALQKLGLALVNDEQKILTFSVDVTKQDIHLKTAIAEAESHSGPITMLFNCAGTSVASRFESTPFEDFEFMLNVNYLGSVKVTQAVLPSMKKQKKGRIVFVSSLAGLVGLYGYTAYSASKFAIVGLAEALHMEVKPYNISVTVSFPPDTDTPGYAEEIKNKPLETSKISESGGLFPAEDVALKTLSDALNKNFMSSVGFEGWLLCNLCSGTAPFSSFLQLFIQVITMGFCRIGMLIYLLQCDIYVRNCHKEREKNKLKDDTK